MAQQIRIQKGQVVILAGRHLRCSDHDAEGVSFHTMGTTPVGVRISNADLIKAYFHDDPNERLTFPRDVAPSLPAPVRDNLERDLATFSQEQQLEALMRHDFLVGFDKLWRSGRVKKTIAGFIEAASVVANERRQAEAEKENVKPEQLPLRVVNAWSLRRWHTIWVKAGRSIQALVPLTDRRGRRGFRLDPEVEKYIGDGIRGDWLIREAPTLSSVIELIQGRIQTLNDRTGRSLEIPTDDTIRRWIDRNVPEYERIMHREGREALEAAMREGRIADRPMLPLQEVEIDHTPLDVLIVSEDGSEQRGDRRRKLARVYLTVAICRTTRMICGFHISFDPPSWTSVMECLRMAILPKDVSDLGEGAEWPVFGLIVNLRYDNGREFLSFSMDAALGQLNIEGTRMPRAKGRLKGTVENWLKNVAVDFCAWLPGKTFRNVEQKGDYPAEQRAILTMAQVKHLFKVWVVMIYHNRDHAGLMKQAPIDKWRSLAKIWRPELPPSVEDLNPLIALVVNRTIQNQGIRYLGLKYQSSELNALRKRIGFHFGREYMVKVDSNDISALLVLDPDKSRWISVPCITPGFKEGTSLEEWRHIVEIARKTSAKSRPLRLKQLWQAREYMREETRRLGARPRKAFSIDHNWYREKADDPFFQIEEVEGDDTLIAECEAPDAASGTVEPTAPTDSDPVAADQTEPDPAQPADDAFELADEDYDNPSNWY